MNVCSINLLINELRSLSFREHDKFISKLVDRLDKICLHNIILDDENIFSFKRTDVESIIKYVDTYSSEDLIKDTESIKTNDHRKALHAIIKILNDVISNDDYDIRDDNDVGCDDDDYDNKYRNISDRMLKTINKCVNQPVSRLSYKYNNSNDQLLITVNRLLYLCMHESSADLSMLSDFDEFKESLDIVGRSFVTRGKPLTICFKDGSTSKSRVILRDTILIAPVGAKSLAAVGQIYGPEYHKVDIGNYRKRMSILLRDNKDLFEKYALTDSKITLKHARSMEEYYFTLGKIGVPLTISGIGKAYVTKQ
jgi:hypothetical protein